MQMLKEAIKYIDEHPRLILIMAWPMLCSFIAALIWIIWKGPWLVREGIEHQQLAILGWIALGLLGVLALNMIAQSSTFFGKLGFKIGNVVDVDADMNNKTPTQDK